jgi:hypothetical protein
MSTSETNLEREIDSTRAEVRADLEALERRLSFDRLVELTLGRVRERGGELAGNLTDAATQNPVPLLLTSIGLGWLMLTIRSNGRYRPPAHGPARATDKAATAAAAVAEMGEQIQDAARSSREALRDAAESVRAGASEAAAATREQADYARERMQRLLDEQPLMVGALGLVAGVLIGAILPATEAEDRVIGDVRDRAVGDAARTSRKRYEAAREHAATYSAPGGDAADERSSRPH